MTDFFHLAFVGSFEVSFMRQKLHAVVVIDVVHKRVQFCVQFLDFALVRLRSKALRYIGQIKDTLIVLCGRLRGGFFDGAIMIHTRAASLTQVKILWAPQGVALLHLLFQIQI